MGEKDQVGFEDDDLDSYDDFDDDVELDDDDDSLSATGKDKSYPQERINARHEIERRAELKALKDELDDWDEFDEDDL